MTFIFFDKNDRILHRRSDSISAHYIHEEFKHIATFPDDPSKPIECGMRVGWLDRNKNLIQCEIRLPVRRLPDGTVSYTAEHVCVSELRDKIVQDKRSYDVSAYMALDSVLDDTGWSVGRMLFNPQGSGNFYWIDAWESVCVVRDNWGVRIRPRITFNGTKITGKYLDILNPSGEFRGVRLQLDRNIEQVGITYDDRNLCTALYGRGKGEVVSQSEEGENTYGRRITFKDVVWSKAKGDPADKPIEQMYVEDTAATSVYGRNGKRREAVVEFPDCEDPEELLSLTWNELQRRVVPNVTISTTILNLHALGYQDQGLDLYDTAAVVIKPWNYRTMLKTVQLDEDLLSPENTRPTMGNYRPNIEQRTNQANKNANVGQQIVQAVPSILQGYIDTAVTVIMSSRTRRQTLADGSEMYVSEDGTSAVRFTGAGILLSSEKDATGDFIWRTAITGEGIIADEITAGVLNAAAVKILGTDRFFWDAENICAINPENTNQQIRFGLYDGKNYGIGFTKDGGMSWQNAIGFNGISLSVSGYTKNFIQPDEPIAENVGDIWTQVGEASSNSQPTTYMWDGSKWNLISDINRLVSAESTIKQQAGLIETKVSTTVYERDLATKADKGEVETITERVEVAESSITQQAGLIKTKVSTEKYEQDMLGMDKRVSNAESSITQQGNLIATKVSRDEYDALEGRIGSAESAITQNSDFVMLEFNKIGLAGSQSGITKVDASGIEVTHGNIGGKTSMNADGFRLYDKSGNVIGGLLSINGQLYAAFNCLVNPNYPGFRIGIAEKDFDMSQFGLHWHYGNDEKGAIYAHYTGMRQDVNGQFGLYADSVVISGKNGSSSIRLIDGDIWFNFYDEDGDFQSWAISDMWNNVPKG